MNQTSNIQRLTFGSLRALAWVCLTLSASIVIAACCIVVATATRPLPALDPVVVLRWEDVR